MNLSEEDAYRSVRLSMKRILQAMVKKDTSAAMKLSYSEEPATACDDGVLLNLQHSGGGGGALRYCAWSLLSNMSYGTTFPHLITSHFNSTSCRLNAGGPRVGRKATSLQRHAGHTLKGLL